MIWGACCSTELLEVMSLWFFNYAVNEYPWLLNAIGLRYTQPSFKLGNNESIRMLRGNISPGKPKTARLLVYS